MTRQDIAHAVSTTLGDYAADYNIDGITEDIINTHGHVASIDDVPTSEYWAIVERHDTSQTVTADHVRELAGAHFAEMAVLVVDTDGRVEVYPASTATARGARIVYDADRLGEYTAGGQLTDALAAQLASELTGELQR